MHQAKQHVPTSGLATAAWCIPPKPASAHHIADGLHEVEDATATCNRTQDETMIGPPCSDRQSNPR